MKRIFAFAAGMALVAGAAWGEDESTQLGRAIFEGSKDVGATTFVGGTIKMPATKFACRQCHGRDGGGGTEGNAPAITWPDLSQPTLARSGYTLKSFADALAAGHNPDGLKLTWIMPRYEIPTKAMESLVRYLADLPRQQRLGITAESITFGVVVSNGNTFGQDYVRLLRQELERTTHGQTIFGRRIVIEPLEGTGAEILARARTDVAAVIGVGPTDPVTIEELVGIGVPVLFPFHPLTGNYDKSMVRTLMPDETQVLSILVDRVEEVAGTLAVVSGGACPAELEGLRERLSKAGHRFERFDANRMPLELEGFDTVVMLCVPIPRATSLLAALPKHVSVYGLGRELLTAVSHAKANGRHYLLVGENFHLVKAAAERDTSVWAAHAHLVSENLVEAVQRSRRQVTRSSMLASIPSTYQVTISNILEFER